METSRELKDITTRNIVTFCQLEQQICFLKYKKKSHYISSHNLNIHNISLISPVKVNVIHTEYKSILVAYFEEDNRKQLLLKLISSFLSKFSSSSPLPTFLRSDRLLIWCEEAEKERQKEKQREWDGRVHLNIMNKYQTSAVDSNEPQLTSTPWVMALFKQFVTRNNIKICLEEKRKSGFAFTSLTYTFLSIKGPKEGGGIWVLQLNSLLNPRTPSSLHLSHSAAIILTDDVIAPGFQLTTATNQTALATSRLATAGEVRHCNASKMTLSHGMNVAIIFDNSHCLKYVL